MSGRAGACISMRFFHGQRSRIPNRINRNSRRARGSALLELALVMPILCLLLLGVFDLGRVYAEQVAVVSAAREGARAATYLSDDTAVRNIVVTEVNNTVALDPATDIVIVRDSGLQTITITVTYRHPLLFGLFEAWGNGGVFTASGTATMPMVQAFGGTPPPVNTPPPTGTPVPTNTPTATSTPTNTVPPTNTPTVTLTPTITPTPCPLTVAVVFAQQDPGTGQQKIYLRVLVTNSCTGAPVTGAVVTAAGLTLTDRGAGYYRSCGSKIGATGTITVNAVLGGQSGSGSGPVGNTNPTCPP